MSAPRRFALFAAALVSTSVLFASSVTSLLADSQLPTTINPALSGMTVASGGSPTLLGPSGTPPDPTPTGSVDAGVSAGGATASPGEGYIMTFQQQTPSAIVIILIVLIGAAASVVIMTLSRRSAGGA